MITSRKDARALDNILNQIGLEGLLAALHQQEIFDSRQYASATNIRVIRKDDTEFRLAWKDLRAVVKQVAEREQQRANGAPDVIMV